MFTPDNTLEGALQRYRAGHAAELALRELGADVRTVGPYTYLPVHGPAPAIPAVDDPTVRPAVHRTDAELLAEWRRGETDGAAYLRRDAINRELAANRRRELADRRRANADAAAMRAAGYER